MVFEVDEIKAYTQLLKGKRILFVMPALSSGGAERVMVTLLKYLDKSQFQAHLLVLEEGKNPLDLKDIGCDVEVSFLNVSRARKAPLALYKFIKRYQPDTVLSTLGYLNEILSFIIPWLPNSIHFVARESSIPFKRNQKDSNAFLHHWIYRNTMKRFDQVICQSEEMKRDLIEHYQFPEKQLILIDNPVDVEYILRKSKEDCPEMPDEWFNILAVGSLKPVKNYLQLLQEAKDAPEDHRYFLLGEGEQRQELESEILRLNLVEKVQLLGHQKNPWRFMRKAKQFWQKSHWEGNSNALKEWKVIRENMVSDD